MWRGSFLEFWQIAGLNWNFWGSWSGSILGRSESLTLLEF